MVSARPLSLFSGMDMAQYRMELAYWTWKFGLRLLNHEILRTRTAYMAYALNKWSCLEEKMRLIPLVRTQIPRTGSEMPGCSLCMGNQARVADNAYVISTSTRNFPNRLGKGAMVFLGSAELSAAAATLGRLPTPEEYLKCYAELGSEGDREKNIYKYLNFDQVESYVEAPRVTFLVLDKCKKFHSC